ncbi:MAG TPA: NAD(P)-binding domain-containing protein, partial [Candidatus Kapabacteria bacterium]|nr:NAD(P)-binding domain-containing protein [Candidatus Kapabacteria bacterium]
MNICFIGGGNMATALIGGLQRQAAGQHQIGVVEPDADKCQQLASQFGVQAAWQLDLAAGSDVLVLAVKPQQLREVAYSLQQYIAPTTLVISIAAGIRLADLQRWLGGHARLVR